MRFFWEAVNTSGIRYFDGTARLFSPNVFAPATQIVDGTRTRRNQKGVLRVFREAKNEGSGACVFREWITLTARHRRYPKDKGARFTLLGWHVSVLSPRIPDSTKSLLPKGLGTAVNRAAISLGPPQYPKICRHGFCHPVFFLTALTHTNPFFHAAP